MVPYPHEFILQSHSAVAGLGEADIFELLFYLADVDALPLDPILEHIL